VIQIVGEFRHLTVPHGVFVATHDHRLLDQRAACSRIDQAPPELPFVEVAHRSAPAGGHRLNISGI
jgi:hypothetical protein